MGQAESKPNKGEGSSKKALSVKDDATERPKSPKMLKKVSSNKKLPKVIAVQYTEKYKRDLQEIERRKKFGAGILDE